MAWTTLLNSIFLVGKRITSSTGLAMRDNLVAVAKGETGAPYVEAGWHPFNSGAVGDGNDGVIYDSAVDGALATVTTPDFVDGYEYLIETIGVSSSGASTEFRVELYRETLASYAAPFVVFPAAGVGLLYSSVTIFKPRVSSRLMRSSSIAHEIPAAGYITGAATAGSFAVAMAASQKITNARLSYDSGNIDAGVIRLLKRRAL